MRNENRERARAFLACRRIALVGASRDARSFSRMVQRALAARGYDVVPVNPAAAEIAGRPAFAHPSLIAPPPEAALLMTRSSDTADAVRDCLAARIRRIWLHRGGGPGSASPEAIALCRAAGVEPITDLCPFMVLPHAGFVHRLHALVRGARRRRVAAHP